MGIFLTFALVLRQIQLVIVGKHDWSIWLRREWRSCTWPSKRVTWFTKIPESVKKADCASRQIDLPIILGVGDDLLSTVHANEKWRQSSSHLDIWTFESVLVIAVDTFFVLKPFKNQALCTWLNAGACASSYCLQRPNLIIWSSSPLRDSILSLLRSHTF